jgi:cysteine dioxygenase
MHKSLSLAEKLEECFGYLSKPSVKQLEKAIDTFNVEVEELIPHLENPVDHPYERKLLYQAEALEVLVMNWAENQQERSSRSRKATRYFYNQLQSFK